MSFQLQDGEDYLLDTADSIGWDSGAVRGV